MYWELPEGVLGIIGDPSSDPMSSATGTRSSDSKGLPAPTPALPAKSGRLSLTCAPPCRAQCLTHPIYSSS
jgi:hypothetical protein